MLHSIYTMYSFPAKLELKLNRL